MYRIVSIGNGQFRGFQYRLHKHRFMTPENTRAIYHYRTTGKWVGRVVGGYEFVKEWLRNLND